MTSYGPGATVSTRRAFCKGCLGIATNGAGWRKRGMFEISSPSKPPQDAGSWLTLPETNMAPENGWLENEFPLGGPIFRGELLVSGRVNKGFVGIPDPKQIMSSWW